MSRRNSSPKSRPVVAVLIVAATVFLLLGRNCGVLGALLAGSMDRLLGAAGTGLLCLTAWALAFILATPAGTFTRMVVAVWHAVKPRHRPFVVVTRAPAEPESDVNTHPMLTKDRRTLDAVRAALKNLDYTRAEYEPIVAQLDPSLGFEKLVKKALATLRVN